LIFSTFFDNNGGAGLTHKILSICNCVLLKDCWIWWLVLVAEDAVDDCPWESRLPSELAASVSKTPKWNFPLFLLSKVFYIFILLSKVFYTSPELSPFLYLSKSFIPD